MIKKLTAVGLTSLMVLNSSMAMALTFKDVPSNYWAYTPIKTLTEDKVISGYPNNFFKPENKVTRAEFASMLVKALNQQALAVDEILPYTDMQKTMWSYEDISKINSLNLVVGYPDKTFKPSSYITKTETMIVLANALSGLNLSKAEAEKVLSRFLDEATIKAWAAPAVSKSVKNNIYVKYPNPKILNANNQATRAEIAELLYQVRKSPALLAQYLKTSKVAQETAVVQHLNLTANGTSNEVLVKKQTAKIFAGNVIETAFVSAFTTKDLSANAPIKLTLKKDLYTNEGTFLIPAGSLLEGTVTNVEKAKLFNKNAKAGFDLTTLTLPNGKKYAISAKIATDSGLLESGYNLRNFKRDAIVTVATTAVGTGIGALAGLKKHAGEGAGIGAYSAAGAGVIAAAIVPGYDINFKAGDRVYIKLSQDLIIAR